VRLFDEKKASCQRETQGGKKGEKGEKIPVRVRSKAYPRGFFLSDSLLWVCQRGVRKGSFRKSAGGKGRCVEG